MFSSGFRDATIIESVRNPHWWAAQPYHKSNTFTLLYWSLCIGLQTVFETDERTDCFTLSKNHLNHDINHTERKNIITIPIRTRIVFKIILPIDLFSLLCGIFFLGEDRFEDLKSLFLLIINFQKTNKIQL